MNPPRKTAKKAPEVRQTLASKYRLLKSNPLMALEVAKKAAPNENEDQHLTKPLKSLVKVMDNRPRPPFIPKVMPKPLTTVRKEARKVPLHAPKPKIEPKTPSRIPPTVLPRSTSALSAKKRAVSTPSLDQLSLRLNAWLEKRGKKVVAKSYTNLKMFTERPKQEEKENLDLNGTFVKAAAQPELENVDEVAKGALLDLQHLLQEGYPPEQCEIWLDLICARARNLDQDPQYWECKATLEQSKGNINSAVEHCKTAIIQGAPVQTADAFLEQLLEKFSILNIENKGTSTRQRSKIIEEARNIFKSSIIQFAVQEKKLKKKTAEGVVAIEKSFVATPVRRSTRLSRSNFTATPNVKLFSSLREIDETIKDVKFERNTALRA